MGNAIMVAIVVACCIVAVVVIILGIKGSKQKEIKTAQAVPTMPLREDQEAKPMPTGRNAATAPVLKQAAPPPPAKAVSTKSQPKKKAVPQTTSFNVAGTSFYQDAFKRLLVHNSDYDLSIAELKETARSFEKIWKDEVTFTKVELIPEPENKEDPNAVRVELDGYKVGYIKRGNCSRVKNLLKHENYLRTRAEAYGGPYKMVVEEETDDFDTKLRIEKGNFDGYGVKVTIVMKRV